jgi:hypothetical protein
MIQVGHSQAVQRSSPGLSRHSSAPTTSATIGVNLVSIWCQFAPTCRFGRLYRLISYLFSITKATDTS